MVKPAKDKSSKQSPMCDQRFKVVIAILEDCRDAVDLEDVQQVSRLWVFTKPQRKQWDKTAAMLTRQFKSKSSKQEQQSLFSYHQVSNN